ncbi:MAG: glucosamine-6-phosphate deaminase [Planctomycetes bacterium]|nr:glucosamine-6-phosphate deaminase [Planctomycetota bacterium]
MGQAAAREGGRLMRQAIDDNGRANIILATGASQFEMLADLVQQDVDWSRVVMFHLDEYIGLPETHPASFRKYLKERFVDKAPSLKAAYFVEADKRGAPDECARISEIIADHPIDVAMVGIGENGHLAFNDPPADFDCEEPYIVVKLDEACRKQQLGEGWFASLDDVPTEAISMSIRHIMKSGNIICTVPDERKAVAVRDALEGPLTKMCPASILRTHPSCRMFLDSPAASLLREP